MVKDDETNENSDTEDSPQVDELKKTAEETKENIDETCGVKKTDDKNAILLKEKELDILKEKLLRVAAEYENYRKRTEKEKIEIKLKTIEHFIFEFLPIIDSIEMAFDSLKSKEEACKKGVEMIQSQLSKNLEKLGISSFGKTGEEFNPDFHSAISRKESKDNKDENTISNVYQKGYKYANRIIRHATVQVIN